MKKGVGVNVEFETAVQAAQEAGQILLSYFRMEANVRTKGVADLVTDADVAAERCTRAVGPQDSVIHPH